MKNKRNLTGLILVCALLLTASLGCQDKRKYTAETPALIIRGGNDEVHYSYNIDGKSYQAKSKTDYALMTGTIGKACYVPGEPEKSYFMPAGYACGK